MWRGSGPRALATFCSGAHAFRSSSEGRNSNTETQLSAHRCSRRVLIAGVTGWAPLTMRDGPQTFQNGCGNGDSMARAGDTQVYSKF